MSARQGLALCLAVVLGLAGCARPPSPAPTARPTDARPVDVAIPITGDSGPEASRCAIAYADAGNLYCFDAGGTAHLLASQAGLTDPAVSFDGRLVAFRVSPAGQPDELWVVRLGDAGSTASRLVAAPQIPNADPALLNAPLAFAWRSGSHTLLFSTRFTAQSAPVLDAAQPGANDRNYDLWSVDADTGAIGALLPAGSGGEFALSPDGCYAAVAQPDGVSLVSADGLHRWADLLVFNTVLTYGAPTYLPRPTWSPDGRFFTVLVPSVDPLGARAEARLYRVDVDGQVHLLRALSGNFVSGGSLLPAVAPDGLHVLYSQRLPGLAEEEAMILVTVGDSAPGAGVSPAALAVSSFHRTVNRGLAAAGWGWSPDSRRFAYTAAAPDGPRGVFLLGLAGRVETILPTLTAMSSLRWLDADTFVFIGRLNGSGPQLYRETVGQEPRLLATGLSADAAQAVPSPALPAANCP